MKFNTLKLDEKLLRAIDEMGFERCTAVQEQTYPESLTGRDVSVQAQTGTGKTAVFLITALHRMLSLVDMGGKLRVLILVPTRELAVQVEKQASLLCRHVAYSSVAMYGGVGYERQDRAARKGVEIVVATPGRLIDFIKSKKIDLSTLRYLIIDEADRMLDMGFMPDVRYILKKAPPREKRQTMVFSATLDSRIRRLVAQFMIEPAEIEIDPEQVTVENVRQTLFHVSREEKLPALIWVLKREHIKRALVFTNMKRTAEELGFKLNGNGIDGVEVITGDLDQRKRLKVMERFQKGLVSILVATDVAARGLHIDDVTHVINYDLPEDAANYVHRIGRTARAGAKGVAYTLACEDLVEHLPNLEKFIGLKIDVGHLEESLPEDRAGAYRRKRPGTREKPAPAGKRRPPHRRETAPKPAYAKDRHKKPLGKTTAKKAPTFRPAAKSTKDTKHKKHLSESERREYYKKKYGESFDERPKTDGQKKSDKKKKVRKKGFFSKIVGRLKK